MSIMKSRRSQRHLLQAGDVAQQVVKPLPETAAGSVESIPSSSPAVDVDVVDGMIGTTGSPSCFHLNVAAVVRADMGTLRVRII